MNVSPVTQTPVQPHNGHSGQLVRRNAAVVTSREHARAHQLAEISRVNSVINTLVNGRNGEFGVFATLQLAANLVNKSAQESVMVKTAPEVALNQRPVPSSAKKLRVCQTLAQLKTLSKKSTQLKLLPNPRSTMVKIALH